MIYGIIVTLLMLLVIGTKIVEQIAKKGFVTSMKEIGDQFIRWDDPSAFFIIYIIGYVIIWLNPQWGSVIIIMGSLLFLITNFNLWNLVFVLPTILVGFLYLLTWYLNNKENTKSV